MTQGTHDDSMSGDEIAGILAAADRARSERLGVWACLAEAVIDLDWSLRYRHLHVQPHPDLGVVLHPKLFRRLVTWAVNCRAKMGNGSFRKYLHDVNERSLRLSDCRMMANKTPSMRLSDWIDDNGRIVVQPGEMVFKEKESLLVGTNGARVEEW